MDSSVNLEKTSIPGNEHTNLDNIFSVRRNSHGKEETFSSNSLSYCSSNDSSASDYSRESDADLTLCADLDDDITALEGVLQLGCMDVFFLPPNPKNKVKKSLVKLNRKGERELNLNVKGPLALGFEAKMKDEEEKRNLNETKSFGSVLQDTITCVSSKGPKNASRKNKVRSHKNKSAKVETRESEFDHFRSLMSLSHGSSSDDDDCDNLAAAENMGISPHLQPFQNQAEKYDHHYDQQQQCQRQDPHQSYHHQHGYPQQLHRQESNFSYEMNVNGRMLPNHSSQSLNATQSNRGLPQKRQGKLLQSPHSTGSMPSQILVEEQHTFEEESYLTYEVTMAPDPPQSSLSRIIEDDYPESSSDEESDSSIVACSSILSETHDNTAVDSPEEANVNSVPNSTSKKGGRVPKVERWRKANSQRLKQSQQLLNVTIPIKEENDEDDRSVDSDQATYSSKSTSSQQTTQVNEKLVTDKISKNNLGSKNKNFIARSIIMNGLQKKDPEGESLAFDSIFARRIEKRRAAKLRKTDFEGKPFDFKCAAKLRKNDSEEKPFDSKSDSTSVNLTEGKPSSKHKSEDSAEKSAQSKSSSQMKVHDVANNAATLVVSRNYGAPNGINNNGSCDGIPEPISTILDSSPPAETLYKSAQVAHSLNASVIGDLAAAAAALALNKEYSSMENSSYPSMENPSFDKHDTENRVPPPVGNGKVATVAVALSKPLKDGRYNTLERPKNPFQDDDLLEEDDIYDFGADSYPLLTSSSSDDADILQPVCRGSMSSFHTASAISSPFSTRIRAVPMTPSPRRSSKLVASPRKYNEWNDTMHNMSSKMAASTVERCPSGTLNRTDSIKCDDSASYNEFFESNMFNN